MAESSGSFTIGGTSPNYATIQLWDDDSATTLDGILEGKCRAATFDENITIGGSTSTSSFYKKLTYDTGAFHGGQLGGGVVLNPADSKIEHVFTMSEAYARVIGIEVTGWQGISSEAFRIAATGIRIEQCIMHDAADINADGIHIGATGYTTYVSNCLFFSIGRSALLIQGDVQGTLYVYNCTAAYHHGVASCVFGCDTGNGPLTSYTLHIKNTYAHILDQWGSVDQLECFEKTAAADWGNSTHNASSDASASNTNATNYQNNADPANQFAQALSEYLVGENTSNDYSGSWEDSWMNTDANTTNYGSDVGMDLDNTDRNALWRVKLDLVPAATRVRHASFNMRINDVNQAQYKTHKCLRNWVESEVTWLIWSTGNSWTTAGALSDGNDVDLDSLLAEPGRCWSVSTAFAAADWFRLSPGPLFRQYVQDAIDGSSGAPKGDDWIDLAGDWNAGTTGVLSFDTSEDTDGSRPELSIWYDTENDPFNITPASGGILDGNGTDLSGDAYPISVDIYGKTRSAWDIGAVESGTVIRVTQAVQEIISSNLPAIRVTQAVQEIVSSNLPAIRATQAVHEILYAPALGQDELGIAAVALALTTNTPTPRLTIERTASGALVLTTATPDPYLTIARSAAEDLALTIAATPSREIERTAAVELTSRVGSDVWKTRTAFSDFTDQQGSWTDEGAGVFRCTSTGSNGNNFRWNHYIPMDRTTTDIEWGFGVRLVSGTAPSVYMAVEEYVNGDPIFGAGVSSINPQYCNIFTSTETTLAADILTNDTSCTLTSGTGWEDSTSYFALQYNIQNDQSDVPNYDTIWLKRTGTVVDGNTVYFESAYTGSTIPSGTKVRQSRSGGTNQYAYYPSGDIAGSYQNVYNWITRPFEDIQNYSTTYAADGDNKMFSSNNATVRVDGGFRPETSLYGIRFFMQYEDATTVIEIKDIYIKSINDSTALVDHSAVGTETLALTTNTPTPLLTISRSAAVDLVLTDLADARLDIERTAAVDLTATVPASGGQPVMFLYPSSDITVTNFEDEGAGTTDIFNSLDEGEPGSAADYITTTSGSGGTYECGLTSKGDPAASDYHYVLFGLEKAAVGTTMSVRATLLEGATQRAQWIYNDIAQGATEIQELMSGAQADSLTAYNDLRMRFEVIGGTF